MVSRARPFARAADLDGTPSWREAIGDLPRPDACSLAQLSRLGNRESLSEGRALCQLSHFAISYPNAPNQQQGSARVRKPPARSRRALASLAQADRTQCI